MLLEAEVEASTWYLLTMVADYVYLRIYWLSNRDWGQCF